jgi:hypothetical protein
MNPVAPGVRALAVSPAATVAAIPAPSALAEVGDFRVLPYQQQPALDGMLFTWFTVSETPEQISITGPGLSVPLAIASVPVLVPVLDYQAPAELSAGGAFPFATTAIFSASGGRPAAGRGGSDLHADRSRPGRTRAGERHHGAARVVGRVPGGRVSRWRHRP